MIIYPLEHKSTELGPWAHTREAGDFRHLDLMLEDGRCGEVPEPQTDGLKITEDHLFAFTSERDLLSYFSLDLLEKLLTWYEFRVDEREFLMSGICSQCWDQMERKMEDED